MDFYKKNKSVKRSLLDYSFELATATSVKKRLMEFEYVFKIIK